MRYGVTMTVAEGIFDGKGFLSADAEQLVRVEGAAILEEHFGIVVSGVEIDNIQPQPCNVTLCKGDIIGRHRHLDAITEIEETEFEA